MFHGPAENTRDSVSVSGLSIALHSCLHPTPSPLSATAALLTTPYPNHTVLAINHELRDAFVSWGQKMGESEGTRISR